MSANKENVLVQAYTELNKFCQNGDYERALKAAGKVLQIAPNEQKAFHCKLICFIQLLNFKEALSTLNNPKNVNLAQGMHFEKAYVQYRLNCPKDALETIEKAPEMTPALRELRAQVLYRLEQYQECYNLYRELVKNTSDDYDDERKANMAAVITNLTAANPSNDLPQLEESTYEQTYNAACTLAMKTKYNEASQALKRAEQLCSEAVLEDGGNDDDVKEESAIIRVQQAYCLQMMGKDKEAAAIYQNILKSKPSDQSIVAIASNNLVVINKDTNVFDSRKRMKAATADGLEHKLNTRQRSAIVYNQAILAIYSNQPDFCKQCCVKLVKDFKEEKRATLIEASSLVKEGKKDQAVKLLLKCGDVLILAAVQVLLSQGDKSEAIKLLENSPYKYSPAIVSVLNTFYCAENEYQKASQLFKEVCDKYKGDKQGLLRLRPLLRAAAVSHQRASNSSLSAESLELMAHLTEGEHSSLARLVKALADHDPQRAHLLAQKLPRVKDTEVKIDPDALESSNWIMGAKVVKKTQGKQEQSPGTPASDMLVKKATKKRRRKTKLPQNADLSKPPDPERWLPKYERTAYRKRRGIKRDVIKGSQGMTTNATDQYDMSKQQPTPAAAAKSPRVESKASSGESAWQRKQQQKKKGKGRKW